MYTLSVHFLHTHTCVYTHIQAQALDDTIAKQGVEAAGPLAGAPIAIKVCRCVYACICVLLGLHVYAFFSNVNTST